MKSAGGAQESMEYKVCLLDAAENERTKSLYQKVFTKDSPRFVDYYYRVKARENRIYAAEGQDGEILSMLHLNPYLMRLGEQEIFGEYIVAVATDERYRGQGMMRNVLKMALEDMRRIGEPMAFLMPAAEAIYRPFDFRYIYCQNHTSVQLEEFKKKPHLQCRAAEKKDLADLAEFSNVYLKKHFRTFAFHTEEYFETLLQEQRCQNGEVAILLDEGKIRGYFFTAFEDVPEVREPVIAEGYETYLLPSLAKYLGSKKIRLYGFLQEMQEAEEKKPVIMARVINPERFAPGLTAAGAVEFCFELRDDFLPENSGIYKFHADAFGGILKKCVGERAAFTISAGTFTALTFGCVTPQEAGMPGEIAKLWEKVRGYGPVFLNEVV